MSLPTRPDVTVTVEYLAATGAAHANVVLFVGGPGVLTPKNNNFLLRIRGSLVAQGFNVAVPDVPSDHRGGVDPSFRASAEYGQDVAAVASFVKGKADLPLWLVGTSNGSISAANGAVRLGPAVAGVVLTSSVWAGGMSYVPIDQIAVPVLLIQNRGDQCPSAKFAGAEQALPRLAHAPVKALIPFESSAAASAPCEPLAPHGYYGIENQVVPAMVKWMLAPTAD